MLRRFSTIFILSFLLVAFIAMTAFAARTQQETARKFSPTIDKSLYYSYPDETLRQDGSGTAPVGRSAFSKSSAAASPGVVIGDTYYDYQHNGTIGRMIDWGPYGGNAGDPIIHFGWMALPTSAFVDRFYAYQHFNGITGLLGAAVVQIQPGGEYAGYVGMSVTPDNKGIPGGHNDQGSGNQTHLYWDFSPGFGFFSASARVPDATATYPEVATQSVIWPKFAYQVGTDTVTHVVAQVSAAAAADPQAIYYFRKVGYEATGTWDFPPYVIDTIYDLSHDIVADRNSDKVALAWTANLRYDANGVMLADGVCDTCSGTSPIHVQWDNDIYYQISDDQGATWNPRVNVTLNRLGEVGYRPYTDLSTTIDAAGNLHIAYSGVNWPADPAADGWGWDCRMFHWSEDNPVIRTVSNLGEFAQEECVPGAWNINMSKMQVSECDGKIYVLWVQFNTADQLDDCAARADGGAGDISGAVNGDLYFSVSSDGGLTWDAARNLTNSYTPGCDPDGIGGDCESDNWPSMTRYGRLNQGGEDWTNAVEVDPSGTYAGNYFLDVQYVHDRDAGGIVQNEGTWQLSNMNWFRLACVEPVPNPALVLTPVNVGQPTWTKPSTQLDLGVTIENTGNVALTYSIVVEEDNGTSGWLNYTGLSGSVPSGLSNVETGTLHLNSGGVQTTAIGLEGRLIFNSNAPTTPDTMDIFLVVADTVIPPVWDTIESACLALSVSNTGNYGQSGTGTANMDWVFSGSDCDTLALVYLYDGSPVVLWDTGAGEFDAAWSIFGDGWLTPNGFRPLGGQASGTAAGGANTFETGTFVNQDSTLGFSKTWYANTSASDCDYMIQKLKVWSFNGAAHNGLRIGEAIDWDIPSDSGAVNGSGFDATRNLIYQIGAEYDNDDTLANGTIDPNGNDCIDSDTRFGGMGFLKSELNGTLRFEAVPRAYTARNDSFVFPAGNFIPNQLDSLMSLSGFTNETALTDLHSVMVFEQNFNLAGTDTIVFWMVVATVENGTAADLQQAYDDGKAWAVANNYWSGGGCCFDIRGNVDNGADPGGIAGIDIADLVYLVAYSFGGGPAPVCTEEADVDASGGAIPIDIADIVYLVSFMFGGGPAPLPCP